MYLKHFGLNEPPFKITPVTSFFFSGANRGEILDALIYAISSSEGIIKITGEVGSGKTMLCRMLLERLPLHVEPIYLANPSLSREEMLYAIADALDLDLEGQRVNIILQNIQNLLEQKLKEGKRVVILVDEAHAMPLDTLEELRLIYNMQIGDQKLLQIVLFGQPELNDKLDQPNMRQLKDRIVHNFTMLPLAKNAIEAYLMFRMRAAGFRGSNIFSPKALALIDRASQGWLRRINVLADKALLAAFVEDAHNIDVHHVHEAIRDSNFSSERNIRTIVTITALAAALILILTGILWSLKIIPFGSNTALPQTSAVAQPAITANPANETEHLAQEQENISSTTGPAASIQPEPATTPASQETTDITATKTKNGTLLQQRLDATRSHLSNSTNKKNVSIQLFYTTNVNASRMERFMRRAQKLGEIENIFVTKIKNGKGIRVMYGMYPSIDEANRGIKKLPASYKKAYAPTLFFPTPAQ